MASAACCVVQLRTTSWGVGTAHSGVGPSHQALVKNVPHRLALHSSVMETFSWGSLFSADPSLCPVDKLLVFFANNVCECVGVHTHARTCTHMCTYMGNSLDVYSLPTIWYIVYNYLGCPWCSSQSVHTAQQAYCVFTKLFNHHRFLILCCLHPLQIRRLHVNGCTQFPFI